MDVCTAGVIVEYDEDAEEGVRYDPDDLPVDLSGHGTACASIIHSIAPQAELYSVRVLGRDMHGRALQFAGGLQWAIRNEMKVVNLSLSTSKEEYYGLYSRAGRRGLFQERDAGFSSE